MEEIVRAQLGLPNLVAVLAGLLGETDVQLYLAGVVILGKVCIHRYIVHTKEAIAYASPFVPFAQFSAAKILMSLLL